VGQFTRDQFENLSKDEKDELMKKKSDRPSARPMGDIYPKSIQRILQGESPKTFVSNYSSNNLDEEQLKELEQERIEKEERHKTLQELRKEVNPTFCPKCGKFMKTRLDTKFYRIRQTCFNCVVQYETKIRIAGLWREYEDKIMTENKLSFLRETKEEVLDYLNGGLKEQYQYVTEEGKIEKWNNEDYDKTKLFLENTLEEINKITDDLSEYLLELNEKLKNV